MKSPGLWLLLVLMAGRTPRLDAQQWRLDLAGSTVRYDTSAEFSTLSFSPSVDWSGKRAVYTMGGSFAAFDQSQWSVQGRLASSVLVGPDTGHKVNGLLSAETGGTIHSSAYRTGVFRSDARLLLGQPSAGGWVGLAAASGWTSIAGMGFASSWGPAGGTWIRSRSATFETAFKPFRFAGSWFAELQGNLQISANRTEITGFAGWRNAPGGTDYSHNPWGGLSLSHQLTGRMALVLGGGWYPEDLLQGLPRGRYASVAVRLSHPRIVSVGRALPQFYRKQGSTGVLSFDVPKAQRVELAGAWTHWERVPLKKVGKRWVMDVTLSPGVYRFNLIVDGHRWTVPAGVTTVDDDFGGKTGLLIVPE